VAHSFSDEGTALERYASRFLAAEVNSSFHRPHRPSTWAKWADLVPADFRFAVKVPKTITHERRLVDCEEPLSRFLGEVSHLGAKLAVLLVQLPPKLAFEPAIAADFFGLMKSLTPMQLVCEPRHPSWFDGPSNTLLEELSVARAAADPAPVPAATSPGGWREFRYWRLHGSPVIYRSAYGEERLGGYADLLEHEQASSRQAWCIFDNTASSAATTDALALSALLDHAKPPLP
jgi:uncharacterized protein YecE (DUF72 family)